MAAEATLDGLSIVIPIQGHIDHLHHALDAWRRTLEQLKRPYEVLLVTDRLEASTDQGIDTFLKNAPQFRRLEQGEPAGIGAAIRRGLAESQQPLFGYSVLHPDYTPSDLSQLLERLEQDFPGLDRKLDLITGHRTGWSTPLLPRVFGWVWRRFWNLVLDLGLEPSPSWLGWRAMGYAWFNRFLFGTRVHDIDSCLKLFRRAIFERMPIQSHGPFVHAEILAKANFLTLYLDEVALSPVRNPTALPPACNQGGMGRDLKKVLSNPRFNPCTPGKKPDNTLVGVPEPVHAPAEAPAMTVRIDAHHHLWRLDQFDYSFLNAEPLAPINRNFLPEDLEPLLNAQDIQKTILVQTQHTLDENRWALGLAEKHDWIIGVVGWVDLSSEECEAQVVELKKHPKFVGIRHIVQDEADDDFIVRPDILRGLGVLEKHRVPYDLLFYVKHVKHAPTVASKFPNLPLVIDHLAKPEIKQSHIDNWLPHFKEAAKFPNVYCKLSGMITEADWKHWKPADLKPYVAAALEVFGPDRCMYGSDWPVCLLAGSYAQVYEALVEALGPISDEDRAKIFGGTAAKFYGVS